MKTPAHVIWLTGMSGAGKTTLANLLHKEMLEQNLPVELLDGDVVRNFFQGDLGYSRLDRLANIKRITFAAMLLARNGVNVVVANIAPYYEARDFIRKNLPNYLQIYVKASVESLISRDVQGHYAKYANSELTNLVGFDDVYEEPRNPNLIIDTDSENIDSSFIRIINLCRNNKILP